MVGLGKIDFGAQATLDLLIKRELAAVVGGDRADRMRFVAEDGSGAREVFLSTDARQLSQPHQAALALDDREGRRLAAAMYGIDLPVAQARAPFDDGRTLLDHLLASKAPPAVVAPVALALELAGAAQMSPEATSVRLIRPDVEIDCLVAHDLDPSRRSRPTICSGLKSSRNKRSIVAKCSGV